MRIADARVGERTTRDATRAEKEVCNEARGGRARAQGVEKKKARARTYVSHVVEDLGALDVGDGVVNEQCAALSRAARAADRPSDRDASAARSATATRVGRGGQTSEMRGFVGVSVREGL